VYFLALCDLVHCTSRLSFFSSNDELDAELPFCLPPVQVWTGNGRRAIQLLRTSSKLWGAELSSQSTIIPSSIAALHTGALF
jgi:hypothetical protein